MNDDREDELLPPMPLDDFFMQELEEEKDGILSYDIENHVIVFKSKKLTDNFLLKHFEAGPRNINIIFPQDGKVYVVEEEY